jgi:Zn-dependent M28 family amino/carboxypeptidase
MLGAHSDSVFAGPGINDDGSGTIGILETAIQLSQFSVNNAVRFGWWSGEEFGLLGSTYYVETLNQTASALDKIKLYLNFDMIASPNYYFAAYDGDGSKYGQEGPPGSAEVEHFYRDWFKSRGYNFTATAFDGRSDYQAFADNGIPCGGLFTGADETKTRLLYERFGGVQGETLDQNYHTALDNYDNLNFDAFVPMAKALAASVAEYASSFASLPDSKKVRARGVEMGRALRRSVEEETHVYKGHAKLWKL